MALQNYSIQMIKVLFSSSYYIPNYQREYAWENNEVSDFLRDLQETADAPNSIHFFGQVVVHNDENASRKYIIDGQQRITTTIILLHVLQSFYSEIFFETQNKSANKNQFALLGLIGDYDDDKKLHLTLSVADNDYFLSDIMLKTAPGTVKQNKPSLERMRKAYYTIYTYIKEGMTEHSEDTDSKLAYLNTITNAITERFQVMYIETTHLDEAFTIFETLNARGKDLETSDLLKNYIFSRSNDINEAQKKWNSMITKLDSVDPTKYIRHFWNSSHAFTREKNLYRVIVSSINKPKDADNLLADLDQYAQCYHDMAVPESSVGFTNPKLINSLTNLKVLRARTFYPILLAMQQSKIQYTEADLAQVAHCIENYIFRNFTICGKVANEGEILFSQISLHIYDNLTSADLICNELIHKTVSDNEFQTMFEVWTGTSSTKDVIRYILRHIDKKIASTEELSTDNNAVHIEHIMPVDSTKWNVPQDIHDEYVWRLGNLTLLSGTINKSISNGTFSDKVKQYSASKIELNTDLCYLSDGTLRTSWNVPDDIIERQQKLAVIALAVWKVQ